MRFLGQREKIITYIIIMVLVPLASIPIPGESDEKATYKRVCTVSEETNLGIFVGKKGSCPPPLLRVGRKKCFAP